MNSIHSLEKKVSKIKEKSADFKRKSANGWKCDKFHQWNWDFLKKITNRNIGKWKISTIQIKRKQKMVKYH